MPCCVDARGADPVVENDSHGQYLFSVAEVWRHTGDRVWLADLYPGLVRAVNYADTHWDTDRDGVPNYIDFDDDNDGIVDTTEGFSARSLATGRWDSNNFVAGGYNGTLRDATIIAFVDGTDGCGQDQCHIAAEIAQNRARRARLRATSCT